MPSPVLDFTDCTIKVHLCESMPSDYEFFILILQFLQILVILDFYCQEFSIYYQLIST